MTNSEFCNHYNGITQKLQAFAIKLTKNHEDALDLVQETVERAFVNREKFQMGTNFKAWMTTIMRNTFINGYRKNRKQKTVEAPIDDFLFAVESKTISNGAETTMMLGELHQAINDLDGKYRVPFLMFHQGFQYDEIADHMDLPIGTVKSRLFFARKQLKKHIEEYYGAETMSAM